MIDCRMICAISAMVTALLLTIAVSAAGLRRGVAEWTGSNTITEQQQASALHYRDTLLQYANQAVGPCDDFYEHVCGGWLAAQSNKTMEESVFDDVSTLIDERLLQIATDHWPIIDTWYRTCSNTSQRQAAGLTALQPVFFAIDQVTDTTALLGMLGKLHRYGVSAFFTPVVAQNDSNSAQNVLYLDWPQMLVPYEIAEATNNTDRVVYEQWAGALALAVTGSTRLASAVLAIEQQIADTMAAAQDAYLEAALPFHGSNYVPQLFAGTLSVSQLPVSAYVAGGTFPSDVVAAVTHNADMGSVRAYLKVRVAAAVLDALPPPPAGDNCISSLRTWLQPVLDHYYAVRYASPTARDGAAAILHYVMSAFGTLLNETTWMDAPTRAAAQRKLAAIKPLISYPDHWASVIPPEAIAEGDHLGNAFRVLQAVSLYSLRSLPQPAERYAWLMATYDVNAYYSPGANDIVFPSGIIQAPFYNDTLPQAVNYGGLASVMGHELGHAFDNNGRLYDWDGNLDDWWTAQSAASFEQQAQCVVHLYDGLPIDTGIVVNGQQTLGENWADLEGLPAAFLAFQQVRLAMDPVLARAQAYLVQQVFGFTEDELFFRAWALHWCSYEPRADEYELAETDVHAPARWRVNIPAQQNADFLRTFNCPTDKQGHSVEQPTCAVF